MTVIFGMTWREMTRKRVVLLTLLLTVVFLIAFWFIARTIATAGITAGLDPDSPELLIERFTRGAFLLTLGYFFGAFVVAFLAIFTSFSAIAGEAEQGVLQAMLPRPLPRWQWYLGRWLGYVTMGILYAFLLYAAIFLITWQHAAVPRDAASLFQAFLLFAMPVPILAAVSMLGSGWLSALGNGVWMTMLYGAGWLGGMIEKVGAQLPLGTDVIQPLSKVSGLISLLMPVDGLQRKMLAVLFDYRSLGALLPVGANPMNQFAFGQVPSTSFVVYAGLYGAAALGLGMWRFSRKDF
ncbi:ABC transporter permease [Cohnella sp. REN36]|uniref:ABC transporter permease n=1 Tax=Cohnella sp. REN36 TaxID=2887347 RepID=UPI001D14DD9F|nr:ABC transporter permease subunit [Cohnella sp. REN36]MCC3375819.1 ABC transporter permease subunit [Cohnella sp. REN36]